MEALGIDLRSLLFQALNFAVLLGGLSYFLYKPVAKLLADRQEQVDASLNAAERLQKENEVKQLVQASQLEAARKEAQAIIEEARLQAKNLSARLDAEAKQHATQLLARAAKEAEEEKARAHRELREELVQTILTTTEKLIETGIDLEAKTAHTHHLVNQLRP